jgi:hypothetical protein
MENTSNPPLLKSTAIYGSILGVILVIYSLFIFIFDIMPIGIVKPIVMGLISMAISIVGVVIFAKKIRNTYYPNEFTFGKAFITCFLIAAVAVVISTLYGYIQSNILDPEYYTRVMEGQKEYMTTFMADRGVPEEQIQSAIDKIDESAKDYNTASQIIKSFAVSLIISAVISLIIAAVIKRSPKIFDEK